MAGLNFPKVPSIIDPTQPSAGATKQLANNILAQSKGLDSEAVFQFVGKMGTSLQSQVDTIMAALRQPVPQPESYYITDRTGALVAWVGFRVIGANSYSGAGFADLWIGPNADPSTAPFFSDGSNVIIGKNGLVQVRDLSGANVATLGVTVDPPPQQIISTSNASPDVLTVQAHGFSNGDLVNVLGCQGDTGPNGLSLTVANVTANTFTVGQNGNGTYIPYSGTVQKIIAPLVITATSNASPDVITIAAHGYVNGDTVLIAGATGDTAINGYRIVENATTNTFTTTDLFGNQINGNGAYAGGGTAQRYYAGLLAQQIAVGPSWANYNIRAFADGSLRIRNSTITLDLNNVETRLSNQLVNGLIAGLLVEDTSTNPAQSVAMVVPGGFQVLSHESGGLKFYLNAAVGVDTTASWYEDATNTERVRISGLNAGGIINIYNNTGTLEAQYKSTGWLVTLSGSTVSADLTSWFVASSAAANSSMTPSVINTQNAAGTRFAELSSGGQVLGTDLSGAWQVGGAGVTIQGNQVVGPRQTGWGTVTGTLSRASFNTGTITAATVAQVLGALITDLRSSGQIGT